MKRTFLAITILVLAQAVAFGQGSITAAPAPAFDAAEIHTSAHVTNPFMRGGTLRSGRVDIRTANMVELISYAYGLEAEKVQGGPGWLEVHHFDITAKAPPDTKNDAVKQMLQTLLVQRFGLKTHMDNKSMPAFVLSLPKGSKAKLKESSDNPEGGGCKGEPQNPPPGTIPYNIVTCKARTTDQIGQELRNMAGGYVTSPVVNQTGLEGVFDFTIKWTSRGQLSAAGSDGISIFDAVDKQLGLKLEPGKVSMPVMVVDSVNEEPTPNASDISKSLPPPPPAEFDVADIKPSKPDSGNPMGRVQNGRVDAQNIPLKMIVQIAWDDLPDERLSNAPKFLENARYDILAKAPPPPPGADIDDGDLRTMLRNLLADRFKMKSHMEERPVEGYVLSLPSGAKPKMAKADPSNRAACKDGDPGPSGKDPRIANPVLNRLITCYNMTMSEFVDQLPNLANGYAHVDVLDTTGLTDRYDFTLSFSGAGLVNNGGNPGQQQAPGESVTPNGAVSLPDAVNKQMGLKLELKKRPMQVLVIDHIEERPTEN